MTKFLQGLWAYLIAGCPCPDPNEEQQWRDTYG